ncbi:MAG: 4-diphosphocytidyl-2-C-methyl-D-erythritol kinase [Planctomycetota bacterium]
MLLQPIENSQAVYAESETPRYLGAVDATSSARVLSAQHKRGWRCVVPSKINLFLEVLGRREDGYHDLDTLMHAIDLTDVLEIYPTDSSSITLSVDVSQALAIPGASSIPGLSSSTGFNSSPGLDSQDRAFQIPSDSSNLVVRALEKLRARLEIPHHRNQGASVVLRKRIPAQAGLGGGSADAVAALLLGSLLWTQSVDVDLLRPLASELGSDLNFFLDGQCLAKRVPSPAAMIGSEKDLLLSWSARCTGRGELVEPLSSDLSLHGVIVHPREGCNTGEVFKKLRSGGELDGPRRSPEGLLKRIGELQALSGLNGKAPHDSQPWNEIGHLLYNRLDGAAKQTTAWVQRASNRLDRYNPHGQCLTGSGSARFCLCSSREQADEIATDIRKEEEYRAYSVSSWRTPALSVQIANCLHSS